MGRKLEHVNVKRKRRFTRVTRQLCLQHYARGFGYKRISKATSIPISTIKYHVRKQRDGVGGSADNDHRIEHAAAASVPLSVKAVPPELTKCSVSLSLKPQKTRIGFGKSVALVGMMHAVHDVMHKNVYAFAHALQFNSHGAPSLMNTADPQMLTLALNLLLQDPWAERHELAALGQILLQRLYRTRDFLRAAVSICQNVGVNSLTTAAGGGGLSSSSETRYWECPVCLKRLVYTGKCAHLMRCFKKCKVLLTHEQLQAVKASAAAALTQSESPEELKYQLKHALKLMPDDKQRHQARYMQLVIAVNTSLQQDVDAAAGR